MEKLGQSLWASQATTNGVPLHPVRLHADGSDDAWLEGG
jgi:hypothetical protein